MPARLRLAERLAGNTDTASLHREVESLREYRDVLHDTMKGLVEQSKGKLKPSDSPELVAGLEHVAVLLRAASDCEREQIADLAAGLEAAREEAAKHRERAEKAERERSNASATEDASKVVAQLLRTAEQQRDDGLREASEQRAARRAAERACRALEAEAEALDAALVQEAASSERLREAHEEAVGRAERATSELARLEATHRALEQAASEVFAVKAAEEAAAVHSSSGKTGSEAREDAERAAEQAAAVRAAAEAAAAEAAAAEASAALAAERRKVEALRTERNDWQAEAGRAAIEIAQLREHLRLAREAPPPARAYPDPGPPKSRFAQYVDAYKGGSQPQTPRVLMEAARQPPPAETGYGYGGEAAPAALRQSSRPGSGMMSARERGGPLLQAPRHRGV